MSGLFEAVVEATEESIYNSLFMATPVTARGRTVDAIPLDRVARRAQEIQRRQSLIVRSVCARGCSTATAPGATI